MTENKPWWKLNGLNSVFYQMFFCSELISSTRLAALSICWGKINLQIPTICRKECWQGTESKKYRKTGHNDSSPLGGEKWGGIYHIQTENWPRDRIEVVGQTSCEGQPMKEALGMEVWVQGYAALGNTSALSASSFAHCWCLFSSRRAYSNVGAPSWP